MDLNYQEILRMMGRLCTFIGFVLLAPALVGLFYSEIEAAKAYLLVAFVVILIGVLLKRISHPKTHKIHHRESYLVVTLTWLLLSLFSAFPMMIEGSVPNFFDAFFESASGYTTTGATVLNHLSSLPHAILFARTLSHWIGGMGILVLTVAFSRRSSMEEQHVFAMESPGPTLQKVAPKIRDSARYLYTIYIVLTLAEFILLCGAGMTPFDAICHSFSTMGTGGFSNYDTSIAYFNSPYIEAIIGVFMVLAGVNFGLYFLLIMGRFRDVIRDSEFKLYLLILTLATLLITVNLHFSDKEVSGLGAFRVGAFQVASIMSTTGFATDNFNVWPTFSMMILFLLFFVGGCAASTAGSVKVIRVLVLIRSVGRAVQNRLHPNAVRPIKVNGEPVDTATVKSITSFVFLYAAVLFIVAILTTFDDVNLVTGFSAAAACLGNIGPGFDSVGPILNYGFLAGPTKFMLALTMIIGRLELYTVIVLMSRRYWNPYRY